MQKKEARRMYRERRASITPEQKLKWDDLLLIQFQTLELPFLDRVLSFYPLEVHNEVNTFIITDYLHLKTRHSKLLIPVLTSVTIRC